MESAMILRGMLFAVSALPLAATPAGAADAAAVEIWALDGFSTPESVAHDAECGVLYVSNIAGEPLDKNGAGHISRVSPGGEMLEAEWITGLDAPKGLALDGATLYVTDIDRLVAIDVEAGEIAGSWDAPGAVFLNDPAVDSDGRVFVSDMVANTIWRLDGDDLAIWLDDAALAHPNGLKVEDGSLIVASWGEEMQEDFSTLVPGHLLAIDIATGTIAPLGSGEPGGNLDGIEPDGEGGWLVTDWIAGRLLRIAADGSFEPLADLGMGSADLGYLAEERIAIVPMMLDGRIVALSIE
ncbi:ATP/GTP-binding protein [soil metagenome]